MNNKLISIIVPVYNVENYVERCINSIIKQTFNNIEIIIVNDGSTDSSLEIINRYALLDSRIRLFSKPNGGLSSARNFGIKHAKGDFLFFVDSDDFIKNNTIELLYKRSLETGADIVVCDMQYLYDNDQIKMASGGDFDVTSYLDDSSVIFINNSACNKLISNDLISSLNFPEGLWYEDLGSIPIIIAKAKKIAKVNQPLYVYYQRSDSIAHSANIKIFDIYKAIKIVQEQLTIDVSSLYIIHGLDLTTLRIKDFDDKYLRSEFLRMNMEYLNTYYPNWRKDKLIKTYGKKKQFIFKLLDLSMWKLVLKIYDK